MLLSPTDFVNLPLQIEELEGLFSIGFFGLVVFFVMFISFLVRLLIAYYIYKDAKKRGEEEVLWLIVGLIGGLIGLIIWLVVRPDMTEVRRKSGHSRTGFDRSTYKKRPSPGKPCPECNSSMRWIREHGRWFCDRCKEYK